MKTTIRNALGIAALTVTATGSGIASAQYYGGLNFDLSRYVMSASGDGAEPDTGFFLVNTALDDRRVRYGLKLGYQLSPRLAWVSRYTEFDRRDSLSPLARSFGFGLDGRAPILAGLSVSGSAGIDRLRAGAAIANGNSLYADFFSNPRSRAYTAGRLGLGMQYQVNSSLGLRFDVERYRALNGSGLGDLGADHLSLGVMLKF